MSTGLVLEFTKMHGTGNDFIVIDNRFFHFSASELSEIAVRFCHRRLGIGADGMLALDTAQSNDLDYRMRYVNADGSLGEMCGNGARCLAVFAREAGILSQPLRFETDAGEYRAFVEREIRTADDDSTARVILPASKDVATDYTSIEVDPGINLNFAFMVSGVPHAVWFGDDLDAIPVETWGPTVRHHPSFASSSGVNVDFVQIVQSGGEPVLRMRTYERGVEAETLACGTGAVSSLVAAFESGRINARRATIRMSGGDVRVGYVEETNEMYLDGPVAFVFRGTVVL